MMAELPVACSDFPDMREIILTNKVGVVFKPADPRDIARAISSIISNPGLAAELRKNAQRVTETIYRWDREKNNLLKLYQDILS
jgi:glycosyltransferase involved in cell wall biosynthesis